MTLICIPTEDGNANEIRNLRECYFIGIAEDGVGTSDKTNVRLKKHYKLLDKNLKTVIINLLESYNRYSVKEMNVELLVC